MIMVLGTIFILLGAFGTPQNFVGAEKWSLLSKLTFSVLSLGVYAGLTLRPKAAKAYVIAIFVCMVLCMILLGLELNLLNSWVNTTCQRKSFSALACAQYRHFRWILAVICFVVALPACCSCMFCAYSLQIALSPPRGTSRAPSDSNLGSRHSPLLTLSFFFLFDTLSDIRTPIRVHSCWRRSF